MSRTRGPRKGALAVVGAVLALALAAPAQGSQAAPQGVQDIATGTAAFLAGVNLPSGPLVAVMGAPDDPDFAAAPGLSLGFVAAKAVPGAVVLNPAWAASWSNLATIRARGRAPLGASDFALAFLHEALHQVRGVQASRDYDPGLEEGLVSAVTTDLGQRYLVALYGRRMHRLWAEWGLAKDPPYKDEVVAVRRASARATGRPWRSPEAFAWRVAMLRASWPDRLAEWARVREM